MITGINLIETTINRKSMNVEEGYKSVRSQSRPTLCGVSRADKALSATWVYLYHPYQLKHAISRDVQGLH